MKPALRELQAAFAAHILGNGQDDLAACVVGDSIPAAARLQVYRHHVFYSLATVLGGTFSTVQALVGEDFFRGMAHDFVAKDLPDQPVLTEYGQGFADFIAGYEPARELLYLADVARLDWALNVAFHAPFVPHLRAADLADVPPERLASMPLRLAPGTAVLRSPHPIERIWQASQPGSTVETVDATGSSRLLILRRADDASFVPVSEGEAVFLLALADGGTLERAAEAGLASDPAFDLTTSFARLLALETFVALQH
jgi:hypothetical protein